MRGSRAASSTTRLASLAMSPDGTAVFTVGSSGVIKKSVAGDSTDCAGSPHGRCSRYLPADHELCRTMIRTRRQTPEG
jgi:hypothetical protein